MTDPPDFLSFFLTEHALPESFRDTVAALHAPLADRIAARRAVLGGPLLVALCGPQASGKSTGAAMLVHLLEARGLAAASLSLDDFYLTRAERRALARRVHPLFATRGPPGTHDMALCGRVIDGLLRGEPATVPRFDKGRDDRAPRETWRRIGEAPDIVLFEGWCVGAIPQPEDMLREPVNRLEAEEDPHGVWRRHANDALGGAYRSVFDRIGLLMQLRPPDFRTVLGWRREQEAKLRAGTKGAAARTMSDAEIIRFVQHYERISRWIIEEMPPRADVVADLDRDRMPAGLTVGTDTGG